MSKAENSLTKTIKAAGVYAGVIIGAGFASGQELLKFFVSYGAWGIPGLVMTGLIFALCGWAVMDICVRFRVDGYNSFMKTVFGKKAGNILDAVIIVFIFIIFSAMIAGTGALVSQAYKVSFTFGAVLFGAICFFIFLFDLKAIIQINSILAPLLVIGGIFFGLYTFFTDYTPAFFSGLSVLRKATDNWFWSAVIYSSYNVIIAVSVLTNIGHVVTNRKIARNAGLLGGISMSLLAVCFALPLYAHPIFSVLELPMLGIASGYGKVIELLYTLLLFSAICMTAISNGFSVIQWIYQKTGAPKLLIKIGVTIFGVLTAHIGFSSFIGMAYPVFGYIGLFEIIIIILFFLFTYKK